jgi:hypothetical protein
MGKKIIEFEKEIYLALIRKIDSIAGSREEKLLFLSQLKNSLKRNTKELLKKI